MHRANKSRKVKYHLKACTVQQFLGLINTLGTILGCFFGYHMVAQYYYSSTVIDEQFEMLPLKAQAQASRCGSSPTRSL